LGPNDISVTAGAREVKFCIQLGYINCEHTDDKPPVKGARSRSHDPFTIFRAANISLEWLKL